MSTSVIDFSVPSSSSVGAIIGSALGYFLRAKRKR
jgi:hypothetical protein